jgi:hypothetical protein
MKRVLLGALVGGIVVFAWGAVSHMVLDLGKDAVMPLPDEERVVEALQADVTEPGFYFFPWVDGKKATDEEKKAWEERYAKGPVGAIVYSPTGTKPMSVRHLVTEFLSNFAAALIAAIVMARSSSGFLARVLSVSALGLFAWLSISVSQWNWYGFPTAFVRAEAIDQVVGWLCGGVALAAIVKPKAA